jgi:hypothetical protein
MPRHNPPSRLGTIKRKLVNKVFPRQKIHFLHIGKTGGSAVTYVLKKNLSTGRFSILIHSHKTSFRDIPAGEKIIFFLRDPISRFVSGFYSRQRQGQPRYLSPWSPEEKAIFERFETPDQLGKALSSAHEEDKEMAQFAMKNISHVNESYLERIGDPAYCRARQADIFFVGFQEQLDDDFSALKRKLKLPRDARLPVDDVHAHKSPEGLDRELSEEAVRNLREWYRDDYEFIDFCREVLLKKNS